MSMKSNHKYARKLFVVFNLTLYTASKSLKVASTLIGILSFSWVLQCSVPSLHGLHLYL